MTFQNPIAFVKRDEIDLIIEGRELVGYAIDIDELTQLGERFDWLGRQIEGEKVDMDSVPKSMLLSTANAIIAASLAPDATGIERREVEASARNIKPSPRISLMRQILEKSFDDVNESRSAEGNAPIPVNKPNRRQRRATGARSNGGGAKPRT